MKTAETSIESPGRTFLKSTSHVRIRETKGNYARSVAVGLQFGIIYLPYEIVMAVIWPLIRNIVDDVFSATRNLILVVRAAACAIQTGFSGRLEATDEPIIIEFDEDGEE